MKALSEQYPDRVLSKQRNERGELSRHDIPDDVAVNVEILADDAMAHSDDYSPRHLGMRR